MNNFRIKRVLNNNSVIASDGSNDFLLLGLSIGFHKKINDIIPVTIIEKKYILKNDAIYQKMEEIFQQFPQDIVDFSMEIVAYIKSAMTDELSDNLYLTIPDHIHSSIERYRQGLKIKNMMLWEVKSFFSKEFEIGIYVIERIKEVYHIEMDEDEAAFIALHIINASYDTPTPFALEITRFMDSIVKEVQQYLQVTFDTESLAYFRFITHLKYFGKKIIHDEQHKDNMNDNTSMELLQMLRGKYTYAYECMIYICEFIEKQFQYQTSSSDQLYLTIHFQKLLNQVLPNHQEKGGVY